VKRKILEKKRQENKGRNESPVARAVQYEAHKKNIKVQRKTATTDGLKKKTLSENATTYSLPRQVRNAE